VSLFLSGLRRRILISPANNVGQHGRIKRLPDSGLRIVDANRRLLSLTLRRAEI
jgi:hypothetical protein